jgi:hypothetical protein
MKVSAQRQRIAPVPGTRKALHAPSTVRNTRTPTPQVIGHNADSQPRALRPPIARKEMRPALPQT